MTPDWLAKLLQIRPPSEGQTVHLDGQAYVMRDGILRSQSLLSHQQAQTSDTFGFKWHQRKTYESEISNAVNKEWLLEKYGDVANAAWWSDHGERPLMLDAGCGAAYSSLLIFPDRLPQVRFLGAEISEAVDVAAARFAEHGFAGAFLQADILKLPIPDQSVDVIFSEGVLHHADSTQAALTALAEKLKPGGRFLFYVYRRKGPIREFTDDYIRERLQELQPEDAWHAVEPLTRLGKHLGELNVEVDVPEDIELLGIPAGPIDLQRFLYWHVFKAFYAPELTFDELNHINYDWYAPMNAHRQSPEEVRAWCADCDLDIEHEHLQEAGITVIARKRL